MKIQFVSVGLSVLLALLAQSSNANVVSHEISYYGADFYKDLAAGVTNEDLVRHLQVILHSSHKTVTGTYDQISNSCSGEGCYSHIVLGYDRARTFMMGVYYLVKEDSGYAVKDVYCNNYKHSHDFKKNPPGPNLIPEGTVLNTEHTWPQSKFTGKYDKEMQKSDLHHLYPTDSEINSVRGNIEFGDVVKDDKILKCKESRVGQTDKGTDVFQPPANHKGNVARALIYFSVQYSLPLGQEQESTLKKWNREDPVDEEEMHRNDEIMKIQGNRNPFVDYPELVDLVANF